MCFRTYGVKEARRATAECQCRGARTGLCCPFSRRELQTAIGRVKMGSAPGPDGIGNEMLRQLGPKAERALLNLFNRTWQMGRTPAAWRRSTIIPVLKKDKPASEPSSYRPISLLSCVGKLAERLMLRRLQAWLESNSKLDPNQSGFRRGHCTTDQLIKLTQAIFDGFESKDCLRSVLVLLDFKSAYDRVWHAGLQAKMGRLGIPACVIAWTMSTIRDRRGRVRWDSTYSNSRLFPEGLARGV